MKRFVAICSVLLLLGHSTTAADPPCDRILGAMSDGCKSISNQLLTITSVSDPNTVCCTNFRYNVCTQSAKAYAAVARVTKICPEEHYAGVVDELEANPLMMPIKKTCEGFNVQTCFVKGVTNLWDGIKTGVNTDVDKLGDSINKNWNEAVSSVSSIAKDISKQFEEKSGTFGNSFKDTAKELQEKVRKNFNEGRQKLKEMFSNGNPDNRYSLVEDDSANKNTGTLDSFVHSIIPDVEFVEKTTNKVQEKPVTVEQGSTGGGSGNNNNGNSFMNFFHSIAGTLDAPSKPKQVAPSAPQNPYSV